MHTAHPVLRAALVAALFLYAAAGWAPPAAAGSFQVNPIRVDLSAAKRSEVVNVHNDGDGPVVVQVEVMVWTQQNGEDVYEGGNGLIVTPPIMTIAPGADHVVRVGLRQPNITTTEQVYRVYLREVPPPPKEGFQGLQVALRMGVPVFVAPAGAAVQAQAQWSAALEHGALKITLRNSGTAHIRVTSLAAYAAGSSGDAAPAAAMSTLSYVLAGQARSWLLKPAEGTHFGKTLRLRAATDAGDADLELDLPAP